MRIKMLVALVLTALGVVAAPAVTADAAAPSVRSGMRISVDQSIVTEAHCTLGAVISRSKAITAGHCGNVGQVVRDNAGVRIGTISANRITRRLDIAVIALAPRTRVQRDVIDWTSTFRQGGAVSKAGVTTGFGRGVVTDPKPTLRTARGFSFAPPFLIEYPTYSVRSDLLSRSGDSGAGVRDASGRVVGILSAGSSDRNTLIAPVSMLPRHLR
ncbi:chymotrypsin family serine protease [Gordonia insulae]|uniref:Peptidase S1 domain-containing protein n=1 Tax=Gordonia insulae TaxID=2420509 RepID=A0A3G8JJI6_9ACTN|nr:hypothetical protein [Gordonia insulae]AZG45108.1 hypothetical protein D7316_01701 [Gordonia insulae]